MVIGSINQGLNMVHNFYHFSSYITINKTMFPKPLNMQTHHLPTNIYNIYHNNSLGIRVKVPRPLPTIANNGC